MFQRLLIVLFIAVGFMAGCTAQKAEKRKPVGDLKTSPFSASFAEAKTLAAKSNKPIYLEFYTDW